MPLHPFTHEAHERGGDTSLPTLSAQALKDSCNRNVQDAFTVETIRQTGYDPVRLHYVVTQRGVVWTPPTFYVDAARSIASLLKLSVPHTIKTAALSGYCSAGSYGDLWNLFFSS